MKNRTYLFNVLFLISLLANSSFDPAAAKDDQNKIAQSQRPGFFKELEQTKVICMKTCPKEVESIFGINVICGNYEKDKFEVSCKNATGHTPVEYCNCDEAQCAKFSVECSADGTACEVTLTAASVERLSCECNGNTCEDVGIGFAKSTCFMRKELESKTCDIHRMVAFSDGRSYHIACDDDKATCVSDGMKINDSIKVEKLPHDTKPGDPK